ncbi:MAG: LacI family DNA-binding transcriptional regulator [Dinghuibacter sp.]|nr:LacI family DNA-binding transcriptional regulator [Dinghuibacter sp.]
MVKNTTLKDVARDLNITVSAVSKALSDHPAMSEATKKLVKETAAKLNYRQNRIALSLKTGKSHIIGVMIPSAEKLFFGSVVHGIEKIINPMGYNLLLFQTNESLEYEKRGIDTFLQANADCIIASIAKETTHYEHYAEIKKRNIPLILFDRAEESLGVHSVKIDDYKGGYMATEHLIKKGYRHIGHIAGLQHVQIFKDRFCGYRDALKAHKMTFDEGLVYYGKNSIESGDEGMASLLNSNRKLDAVFCVEDFTALGAMQVLKEKQVKIPKQMGVIGFANESFGKYISPTLTTIDQQTILMGEEAAKLFLKLNKRKNIYGQIDSVVLEPIIVERESTKRK